MNPWSFMRRSNHLHSRTGCAPNKTYQKIAGCCRGSLWSWWLRKGCSARYHSKMEMRITGDLSFLGEMISSPDSWKFCMEVFGRSLGLCFSFRIQLFRSSSCRLVAALRGISRWAWRRWRWWWRWLFRLRGDSSYVIPVMDRHIEVTSEN